MKFYRYPKLKRTGPNPRRIAIAKAKLKADREKLPLFASQIEANQETPEERILRQDSNAEININRMRDFIAYQWKVARKRLLSCPGHREIFKEWNNDPYPKSSEYFAEFVAEKVGRDWSYESFDQYAKDTYGY